MIEKVHVAWITAALGSDGDTLAITGATQPSLEDLLDGVIPGLPAVELHNPVLAYQNGDDILKPFHLAARGELDHPFSVGCRRVESRSGEGVRAGFGVAPCTGQPIPTCTWIDRLAKQA